MGNNNRGSSSRRTRPLDERKHDNKSRSAVLGEEKKEIKSRPPPAPAAATTSMETQEELKRELKKYSNKTLNEITQLIKKILSDPHATRSLPRLARQLYIPVALTKKILRYLFYSGFFDLNVRQNFPMELIE